VRGHGTSHGRVDGQRAGRGRYDDRRGRPSGDGAAARTAARDSAQVQPARPLTPMADLKRQLGLLDATMINVGTIIASAIFIVPSAIASGLGATAPAILVWVVGGLISLLGALAVAELGAAMPDAGGQYVYLTRAYGPMWGYLYGWTAGVVINPGSIAAVA